MPGSTGPDLNTYTIPEVQLGDTFNIWRDASNTAIYKLNKLKLYDGSDSNSVGVTYTTAGVWTAYLLPTVTTGHTFSNLIRFSSGLSASALYASAGSTFAAAVAVGGGLSASALYASTGSTFGSTVAVVSGLSASALYASTGSTFGSTLYVGGGATFASVSDHVGAARFSGGLSASALYASTGSTFASTLAVVGGLSASALYASTGSTFESTLYVGGGATFASVSDHVGAARFSGGLSASALYASTGSTFGSTLYVGGGATFASVSDHVGAARFSGGLSASALYASTGSTFGSTLYVGGGATFASVSDHVGAARFSGGLSASALYASTGSTFGSTLYVGGGVTANSTLDVSGAARFNAGATFASVSDHVGAARFSGGATASILDVIGSARFSGGLSASALYASTGSTFGSTLYVGGGATFASVSDHVGAARFSGGLSASALYASTGSTFGSTLYVGGGVTFTQGSDHAGAARFNAGATASTLNVGTTLNVESSFVLAAGELYTTQRTFTHVFYAAGSGTASATVAGDSWTLGTFTDLNAIPGNFRFVHNSHTSNNLQSDSYEWGRHYLVDAPGGVGAFSSWVELPVSTSIFYAATRQFRFDVRKQQSGLMELRMRCLVGGVSIGSHYFTFTTTGNSIYTPTVSYPNSAAATPGTADPGGFHGKQAYEFPVSNGSYGFTPSTKGLFITNAGRVGIGTSVPSYDLVVGSSNGGIEFGPEYAVGNNLLQCYNRTTNVYTKLTSAALSYAICSGANEKVTIDSSGNVGIGTTSPTAKLQTIDTYNAARFGVSNANSLTIGGRGGGPYCGIGYNINFDSGDDNQYFAMGGDRTSLIRFHHGGFQFKGNTYSGAVSGTPFPLTDYMNILASGFVGIGTALPKQKLHVIGETTVDYAADASYGGALWLATNSNTSIIANNTYYSEGSKRSRAGGSAQIQFWNSNDAIGSRIDFLVGKTGAADAAISFNTAMSIDPNANVGIGTTNPTSTLHVVGTTNITSGATFGGPIGATTAYFAGNVGIGITTGAMGRRILGANTRSGGVLETTAKLEVRGDICIPSGGFFVSKNMTIPSGQIWTINADENAFFCGTLTTTGTLTIVSGGRLLVL